MNNPLEKFQDLLCELFQFDCADLDFGIYRIMNHKRDVIERFITQNLPRAVAAELERGALAEQSQATRELQDIAAQIKETLGADALDADGNLAMTYHGTPLGKKYLSLKARAAGARGREAIEAGIHNYLYAFFSRYYQDGDFISKRRYSKRERYAIPYNGEGVYLYWANHDQYYVKTAEYLTDYAFTAPNGVSVHFKLQTADVEQNNVKGDKRFFLPRLAEIAWDEAARQLVIPCAYRPLTAQENIAYGQKNQQEAILAEVIEKIPKQLSPQTAGLALAALTAGKRQTGNGQPVTCLAHHLRQYTRRNTSDFFIHKDLKGFLCRELDFYLKNEVLNLDEMEAAGEDRAEGWFQMMRVIKAVGRRIIAFLDQIEGFQKMLWEKRKFITETHYCIAAGRIAADFSPEIAACEPQWEEWKALFHVDEEQTDLFTAGKSKKDKRIEFLKSRLTLVLDTKHFDQSFVDRLLGSFDDLDEMTDGVLVHSENWQALNLLMEKYRLVEMAAYFDTVLLPRIKKVTYIPEWKDGKPRRIATAAEAARSPRIIKYLRLESYEDALNNIAFDDASGQQAMQFDDYLLQYILTWETRKSETLLNVEKLARPFHYKLRIHADGQTHEKPMDISETFNYLLGLHVQMRRVYDDGGRRYLVYRGQIDHHTIAVIWRETEGWQKAAFECDKQFVAEQKLTEGADEVFVNGDSLIPGARALEPIFKARMFAPVEG